MVTRRGDFCKLRCAGVLTIEKLLRKITAASAARDAQIVVIK
jgi:hypothetical protein